MLEQDLELEHKSLKTYEAAWSAGKDNTPLRVMLEKLIHDEQASIETLEKILRKVTVKIREAEKLISLRKSG